MLPLGGSIRLFTFHALQNSLLPALLNQNSADSFSQCQRKGTSSVSVSVFKTTIRFHGIAGQAINRLDSSPTSSRSRAGTTIV